MPADSSIEQRYQLAREQFAGLGVDADAACQALAKIAISIHCWQGDDVGGFENAGLGNAGGGTLVTGNYPGKARTPDELRADFDKATSLIPGKHRISLHACYAETAGKRVDRDALSIEQFANWVAWAKSTGIGIDFNPTYFAHPRAGVMTLASHDESTRKFWVEHGKRSREIAAEIGKRLGKTCINNVWIPDGMKDTPADRYGPRKRLEQSLDEMFATGFDTAHLKDAVEGKLFGIGLESYVVGSHEFYFGYCMKRTKLLTMDAGHYHPTESMGEKLSAVLCHLPEVLLHVSRGVRWDSDHVITLDDNLREIAREIVVNGFLDRVAIGLDYFDATINRVAAWACGVRNIQKALLIALLEPTAKLRDFEQAGDYTSRLALQEELRTLPVGAVWDRFCATSNAPVGLAWLDEAKRYERDVLSKRG